MKKNRIIAIIAALAMILPLCACDNTADQSGEGGEHRQVEYIPEYGGILRLACFVPDTLNPLVTQYRNVRDVLMTVYEGLFKANSNLRSTPVLADSFTVSASNKIYTIKLKPNVTFHDGSAFDANDVAATFNYIMSYPTPYTEMLSNVLSCTVVDASTVSVELISPQTDFVNNLDFPILPSGLTKESFAAENAAFVPIGTGRFSYDGQIPSKYMTCVRYDNWHGGKDTYIDGIKISFMHNSDDIFHAFDAGEIDMYTTDGSNWGEFSFTSDVTTYETGSPRYTYIGINTGNSNLADAAVRRDINAMLNKKELVTDVIFNHAVPADLPVIATAYYNEVKSNNADSQKDGEISAAETPQKTPDLNKYKFSAYLLFNSESKEKQRAAQFIKKTLEPYGITVVLQSVDFDNYRQRIAEGNYDLYIGEVVMQNNMNTDFMFNSQYRTAQNLCIFSSGEFDSLLNNLDMMNEADENASIVYTNLKKYFLENVPQIPLFHTNTALFVNNRIKGTVEANMSAYYSDVGDFFINTK